jgi:hypothetical protein
MIAICDMKMLGGEAKQNPRDSTYTVMLINYLISIKQKLNIVIKFMSLLALNCISIMIFLELYTTGLF